MNRTEWKPREEIDFILGDAHEVAVLSCGTCANLSRTGGTHGIRHLKSILAEEGREITFARCIVACCPEEIVREALSLHRERIARSDVLVVLSCAAGLKSALLCDPPVRTVSVLDPVGSVPESHRDDLITRSPCTVCGHCVISHTAGICPLALCPAGRKYGPCKDAPEDGAVCAKDGNRDCVWRQIGKVCDLASLAELRKLHRNPTLERLPNPPVKDTPASVRKSFGWLLARTPGLQNLMGLLK